MHEILTERLRLRQLPLAELRALLEGVGAPGLPWAEDYPLDGSLVAAAIQVRLHEGGVDVAEFGQYQVIRRSDRAIIGDIGFQAPPDVLGTVTIGFGIVPAARRQGFATEALSGVLTWALHHPAIRSVHADTDLVNIASQHVLQAAGMRLITDEGDRKLYEISANAALRG